MAREKKYLENNIFQQVEKKQPYFFHYQYTKEEKWLLGRAMYVINGKQSF